MRLKLALALLLAGSGSAVFAQESNFPVTLGVKVGIPVTDMFSAGNTSEFGDALKGSNYSAGVPRYEFGVSGEIHLTHGIRFELDGLYKRGGFEGYFPGSFSERTTFNQIEVPGVFKKNLALGHYRPFVEVGASYRRVDTVAQTTYGLSLSPTLNDGAREFQNRNSFGGVAGIGFTFKKGPFELSPEARYTRWANQSFAGDGLRTNLNQGDVLLGISF